MPELCNMLHGCIVHLLSIGNKHLWQFSSRKWAVSRQCYPTVKTAHSWLWSWLCLYCLHAVEGLQGLMILMMVCTLHLYWIWLYVWNLVQRLRYEWFELEHWKPWRASIAVKNCVAFAKTQKWIRNGCWKPQGSDCQMTGKGLISSSNLNSAQSAARPTSCKDFVLLQIWVHTGNPWINCVEF